MCMAGTWLHCIQMHMSSAADRIRGMQGTAWKACADVSVPIACSRGTHLTTLRLRAFLQKKRTVSWLMDSASLPSSCSRARVWPSTAWMSRSAHSRYKRWIRRYRLVKENKRQRKPVSVKRTHGTVQIANLCIRTMLYTSPCQKNWCCMRACYAVHSDAIGHQCHTRCCDLTLCLYTVRFTVSLTCVHHTLCHAHTRHCPAHRMHIQQMLR